MKIFHNLFNNQLNFLKKKLYFCMKINFNNEIKPENFNEINNKSRTNSEILTNHNELSSGEDEESTNLNFSSISDDYMNSKLEVDFAELKLKCNGCGTRLQTKKDDSVGFIPNKKLKEFYSQNNDETSKEKQSIESLEQDDDFQVIIEGEEE